MDSKKKMTWDSEMAERKNNVLSSYIFAIASHLEKSFLSSGTVGKEKNNYFSKLREENRKFYPGDTFTAPEFSISKSWLRYIFTHR